MAKVPSKKKIPTKFSWHTQGGGTWCVSGSRENQYYTSVEEAIQSLGLSCTVEELRATLDARPRVHDISSDCGSPHFDVTVRRTTSPTRLHLG